MATETSAHKTTQKSKCCNARLIAYRWGGRASEPPHHRCATCYKQQELDSDKD